MKNLRLYTENDITTRINIIGEGHIALVRKLDQALENKKERERMKARVLWLENEVKRLREYLEA